MERKKIPSKTRILIALILGGIFLIGGFVVSFNEPWGNTAKEIQQVEDAIGKEFTTLSQTPARRGTNRLDAIIDEQFKPPLLTGDQVGRDGKIVGFVAPGGFERFWEKVDEITSQLVYENKEIAKAKALLHFENNPVPSDLFDSYLWKNRFDVSKQNWKIQTSYSRILTSTGIGFGIFFAVSIITYLILTIVSRLWYFLLNRISELSQAIRGR